MKRIQAIIFIVIFLVSLPAISQESDVEKGDFYQDALELINNFQFTEAEEFLNTKLTENPDDYLALNTLALLRSRELKYREAVDILIKVKELKPDILSSYLNLGIGYIKIGEVEKASVILKQGIELFPSNAHLYYNLGVAYHYMDEVQLAEQTYKIAYSLDPEHPQTLYNLALIYHSRDKTEKALKYWEEYIEVAKDKPEERIYLQRALEMMSDLIYEDTLKDLNE